MIPKTMKAAVARAYGQPLQIEQVPVPNVTPGRILVKVAACGVCHTDLHAINGDWPVKATLPLIPGHEGVGTVVAVGEGVTQVKVGDRVGVPWLYTACGHCEHCFTGWETLCESQQNTGYSVQGSYAEYVLADPNTLVTYPIHYRLRKQLPFCARALRSIKDSRKPKSNPVSGWLSPALAA